MHQNSKANKRPREFVTQMRRNHEQAGSFHNVGACALGQGRHVPVEGVMAGGGVSMNAGDF